jgi:hypothetical protein
VNSYEHLVGEHFTRNGLRYTVVKSIGATVVAAYLQNRQIHRVLVRLADVLDALEVTEINITAPLEREKTEREKTGLERKPPLRALG